MVDSVGGKGGESMKTKTYKLCIVTDRDGMARRMQKFTMKQRGGWKGFHHNNNIENKQRGGGEHEKSDHINPAALRSLCNLASSAQACASRTSGSEDGLSSSVLFPLWFILVAVSTETAVEVGEFGSSSREREKPCRSMA